MVRLDLTITQAETVRKALRDEPLNGAESILAGEIAIKLGQKIGDEKDRLKR